MSGELRVGVIGTGGMGERHAHNLNAFVTGARVTAVMDVDSDRAAAVATPLGATVLEDAVALISSPDVDAVVIASPDPTHAELALACLEHRKPALVEKPLTVELRDAARVLEAEAALGRRLLQVGFMRRYDPAHVAVHEAVTSGRVGRPIMFRCWHRNPAESTPPSSADVLIKAGVHDIDSARWMLDQEPSEVSVLGTTIDPGRTDELDLQLVTMTMQGGAIAAIEINKNSGFGYEFGVEITGASGMVSTPPHHTPVIRGDGEMRQPVEADWLARFATAYVHEARAWIGATAAGAPAGPSTWDGYVTLATALAGAASIEQRRPVGVELPERPALYG